MIFIHHQISSSILIILYKRNCFLK